MLTKKDWSVKIPMSEMEYEVLENCVSGIELNLKGIINKSVRIAFNDYKKNKTIRRNNMVYGGEIKLHSFKLNDVSYNYLSELSDKLYMNNKELLRQIISFYPILVKEDEESIIDRL